MADEAPLNPYEPPKTAAGVGGKTALRDVDLEEIPSPAPGGTIMATQGKAKDGPTWRIAFGVDELWLVPPAGSRAYALTHLEVAEHVDFVPLADNLGFVVRAFAKPTPLWVGAASIDTLLAWLGRKRSLHLGRILKKRLKYSLPLGLFVAALSMPPLHDRFDVLQVVFGVGLVALGLFARVRPAAGILAVNGVLWLCLVASSVLSFSRTDSKLTLGFAAFQALIAWGSLKAFGLFRRIPDNEEREAR